jgi:ESS family glutamate:Na+ symporter
MIEAINIDEYMMLAISIFVLFIGMYPTRSVPLLANNYIPPAVTGGLLFSIISWVLYEFAEAELVFDMHFRDLLLLVFFATVGLGALVNTLLDDYGLLLPGFLTSMFVAIALTNIFDVLGRPLDESLSEIFGEVSLNIFLTMSMMSMQLWLLGSVLGYAMVILLAQIVLMVLFAIFVVFRFMGRDYDAAVMTAGFTGLGLGATPVALANMDAVTRHYGYSLKAFIVMPIIGAFFIDILNAGVINSFIALLVRL